MIKKISKLNNFGIFHNFTWSSELLEFARFNLIYGWNGSGKTTISRVLASFEKKCTYDEVKFKQYPENGEFEIKTDDEKRIVYKDVSNNQLLIKVFNQDFVDENISFDPSDSCNPIISVSEEDIESKKRLVQLKQNKIAINKRYEQAKKEKSAKEETKNIFLTGLGREIANILFEKSYNKTKVEKKINEIGVENFADKTLSSEDKKKYEVLSKSDPYKIQTGLSEYKISFSFENENVDSFQKIFEIIDVLLYKKVVSETLERLKNDQPLNNWVKQGFDLHKTKGEKEKCLFCQKQLDNDFLTTLSKHFSKEYEDLQNAIKNFIREINGLNWKAIATKNDDLYPDLKEKYTRKATELNQCIEKMNIWKEKAIKSLQEKYDNPLIEVLSPSLPEDYLSFSNGAILELNKILNEHNEKATNHEKEVFNAREKLELNSIATALGEQGYNKMWKDLEEASKEEKEALGAINENNSNIEALEKKTSKIGKAIVPINKLLEEFFGRKEIELSLDEHNKGYTIKRNGIPAKNLSEGEKTAIAFSYFVVKVDEGDFDKSRGIIFIDDPISSFDTNFIYHCFSMIKEHFSNVGQLFVSTHNFQLFNLVKEWFIIINENKTRKNKNHRSVDEAEKLLPCEFFMVETFTELDVRKAKIAMLDKTLRENKSEYNFLFAKLKEFVEKQNTQYVDLYTIGNIARRFMEIFVDFKIPKTDKLKNKIDKLIEIVNDPIEKISAVNVNRAYKLVNEFSHNSDPTSTIEHKDKNESKEAIRILLNIVKESDKMHFEILENNLGT